MNLFFKIVFSFGALLLLSTSYAQNNAPGTSDLFNPNHEKERQFLPYLAIRHGGLNAIEEWKKNNTVQYYKELWYYTESFYIKRNYTDKGVTLDESIIDISRFEKSRKPDEEAIVMMPGFKDALVLLPIKDLKYNPNR